MSTLGEEIRRLRGAAGLTQVELAARLGMTQGFVASLETGVKTIATTALLFALCDALNVKCEHFEPFLRPQTAHAGPAPAEAEVPKKPAKGKRK